MFVPLYLVFNSPATLLVVESLFAAGALWFLYRICRHYDLEPAVSGLICILFLNYKYYARGIMFDFHVEMLIPFFLLGAIWYLLTERKVLFWTFIVLALMCKEDIPIYVLLLGAYIIFGLRHRLLGLITSLVSVLWAVATWKYLIPWAFPAGMEASRFISRWAHLGESYTEVVITFVSSPLLVLEALFSYAPMQMLGLLLFIPFVAPEILLIAAPGVILNTTSGLAPQAELHLYYAAPLLAFVLWALVVGMKRFTQFCNNRRWLIRSEISLWPVIITVILALVTFGDNFMFYRLSSHVTVRKSAISKVRDGSLISAQTNFIPHLTRRTRAFVFPEERGVSYHDAEYVLIDYRLDTWPLGNARFHTTVDSILDDTSHYEVIFNSDSVLLIYNKEFQAPAIHPIL